MTAAPSIRHRTGLREKKLHFAEHKFFLLFVLLLASLIFYPYVREGTFSYEVFRVGSSAGIVLAVYAVKVRRTLLICAILLAIPIDLCHPACHPGRAATIPVVSCQCRPVFRARHASQLCLRRSYRGPDVPPHLRRAAGKVGNDLRSDLHLPAHRLQLRQYLRGIGRPSAASLLFRSGHESAKCPITGSISSITASQP